MYRELEESVDGYNIFIITKVDKWQYIIMKVS